MLVDLTPEELQLRLQAGKVYPPDTRSTRALTNFFRLENLAALRELALREVAEDVEARRHPTVLDPDRRAPARRAHPRARHAAGASQRLVRRAWRSAQRLGAELDVLWVRRPGSKLSDAEREALAALRRLGVVLGAHFLEEEADDFVAAVREVARRPRIDLRLHRHAGRPPRSEEVLRGSLVMRLVRALPGIDIRIVADPAKRENDAR